MPLLFTLILVAPLAQEPPVDNPLPPADDEPVPGEAEPGGKDPAPGKKKAGGKGRKGGKAGGAKGNRGGRTFLPDIEERERTQSRQEERRLVAIERDVVEALIAHRPWLASERGASDRIRGLGGFAGKAIGDWERALDRAALELGEVGRRALTTERRNEMAWLESWLQTEILLHEAWPRHRVDPSYFVEGPLRAFRALCDPEAPQLFARLERTSICLDELAKALRAAQRNTARAVGEWIPLAREGVDDLRAFLAEDVAELAAAMDWRADERATFERRLKTALEAVDEFETWLVELEGERTDAVTGLPLGLWEHMAALQLGLEFDYAETKLALRTEIGRLQGKLGKEFRDSVKRVVRLKEPGVRKFVLDEAQRLTELAYDTEWLDVPAMELGVTLARTKEPPRLPANLMRRGPARWELAIEPPAKSWEAEVQLSRAALLSPAGQRALAVRHGPVGEALIEWVSTRSTTLTRSWIQNEPTIEGFGLFATHWTLALGWTPDDGDYMQAVRRMRIWAMARLLVTMEIHAESVPLADAAKHFSDWTGCDPLTAHREAVMASRTPMGNLGYLVFRELRELEGGPERSTADVVEAVLREMLAQPSARVGDLLEGLQRKGAPAADTADDEADAPTD